MTAQADRWSRWLLERRDGGLEDQRSKALEHLAGIRDRVLENAQPLQGATLLDVEPGSVIAPVSFDALLDSAPNPNAPTTREAITRALTEPEQRRFLAELRSAFKANRVTRRMAGAYVVARR